MVTFKVKTTINQPLDIVVTALMNPDNFTYWTTDLERFEVIKGKPGEVGSIGHLHYLKKGRSYLIEDKLIYSEPGKKYKSQVTGDDITAKVETTLNSLVNGTEMIIKWSGEGKNFVLKLLLPLFKNKMIKQSQKRIRNF